MIDLHFRCVTRARWLAAAANRGLTVTVTNPNGTTSTQPAPGVAIDEIGNIVATPAVMNGMTVVTPAVMDLWHWVNVRLHGPKSAADLDTTIFTGEDDKLPLCFIRSKLARYIRENATPVTVAGMRAYQWGTTTNRVQLIDPRDIVTPPRVWLGGMTY